MHRYVYIGGEEIYAYPLFSLGTILIFFLFNFLFLKKKKQNLSRLSTLITEATSDKKATRFLGNKTLLAFIETFFVSSQYVTASMFIPVFGEMIGQVNNYFGALFTVPLALVFFCYIIGVNPLKQIDLIALSFPLSLVVSKMGCFFNGCCYGYEWEHGLYNARQQLVEIPIQLIEIAEAILIFIFLMIYKKKAKPGTLFPLFTILYSGLRFFSEFFRADMDPLFWYIKPYHLFCITGIIIGIAEYIIVIRYNHKLVELCNDGAVYNFIKKEKQCKEDKLSKHQKKIVHHTKKLIKKPLDTNKDIKNQVLTC